MTTQHQLAVFRFAKERTRWLTAKEIAAGAGVAQRTARHHAAVLTDASVFERVRQFDGNLYRFHPQGNGWSLVEKLEQLNAALNGRG
jgi:DNA-binding transcriptional ArsR family regulator